MIDVLDVAHFVAAQRQKKKQQTIHIICNEKANKSLKLFVVRTNEQIFCFFFASSLMKLI